MPIYEFYCPKNHTLYSFYARSTAWAERIPRCPDQPEYPLRRVMSSFSVTGRAKEEADGEDAGDLDDPRMEKAMAAMEREFAGMDPDHPDPRQMAQLMRRMADLSGEKMPEEMNEMMRRMEAGEDPDKLEEEYADVLDADGDGDAPDSGGEDDTTSRTVRAFRRRRPPRRDATLYEMADYVD